MEYAWEAGGWQGRRERGGKREFREEERGRDDGTALSFSLLFWLLSCILLISPYPPYKSCSLSLSLSLSRSLYLILFLPLFEVIKIAEDNVG